VLREGFSEAEVLLTKSKLTLTVNSTDFVDDGDCDAVHCTLPEAIYEANQNAGSTIVFDDALAQQPICVTGVLPSITANGTVMDGTVGSGLFSFRMELCNSNKSRSSGLALDSNSNSIQAMEIFDFTYAGISISGDNNTVENCLIGIDAGGTNPGSGNFIGMMLTASADDNVIGGTA